MEEDCEHHFFCTPRHLCWVMSYHIRIFFFHSIHPLLCLRDYNILLHPLTYVGRSLFKKPLSQPESLVSFYYFMKSFFSFGLSFFPNENALRSRWFCLPPASFSPLSPQVKFKSKAKPPAMGVIAQLEESHIWDFSRWVHNCAKPQSNFNMGL